MAETSALNVQSRERTGKGAARAIRRAGLVPGIIYGDSKDPTLIAVDPGELLVQMTQQGFNTRIFEIDVGGSKHRAMAQEVQIHPVKDVPIHVDFRRIGKDTVVTVSIPVRFDNEEEAPGIRVGGVLNIVRHEIEVRGRPDDLPDVLIIDLTGMEIGDSAHMSAISLPDGITPIIGDRDFTVCTVAPPTILPVEEEVDETEEGEEGEEIEGEEGAEDETGEESETNSDEQEPKK